MQATASTTSTDAHSTQRLYAEQRANFWLAEYNAAAERNNLRRASACWEKAQRWLDRLNKLDGYL